MEMIVGKTAGFCYGVKRAVEGAKEELENSNDNLYCLGELVHNKEVINYLSEKGLNFIDDINEATGETIIRAHGVEKRVYEIAKSKNIKLKDFTCPNVLKIHEIAEQYAKKGFYIFLTGAKDHPEIIGTISYCGSYLSLITKEDDTLKALRQFEKSKKKKLLLISQTTFSLEEFYIIKEIVQNETLKDVELVIKNTICMATELRQKETDEISKKVDYMIIIGGKNSSNTKKLFDIAQKNCPNSICIETKQDLNLNELKNFDKIGIMAGASTPDESIKGVLEYLKEQEVVL